MDYSCSRVLLLFLGAFVNKPTVKFPYKRVEEYGDLVMEGLPPGVELLTPTRYGKDTLVQILNNKHQLKLRGIIYIASHSGQFQLNT